MLGYHPLNPGNRDEGVVLYDALRIARGEVMYRDFFEFQGPVFYYLYAGLLALTGPEVVAARLLQNVIAAVGAALLAVIVARGAGRAAGVAAAVVYGTMLVPLWPYAYPHWLALVFVLGALVLLGREEIRPRAEVGAGVLLALSAATIQSLGLPALVAAAAALALPGIAARKPRQALFRPARVLAGALAVFVVVAGFFAAQGALAELVYSTLVWPFGHYLEGQKEAAGYAAFAARFLAEQTVAGWPWRWFGAAGIVVVIALPFLAVAAAVKVAWALVSKVRVGASGFATERVLAVAMAAVLPVLAGAARQDLTHVGFVAAFGFCGAGPILEALGRLSERARRAGVRVLVALAVLMALNFGHKTLATWGVSRAYGGFAEAFAAQPSLVGLILPHTGADERIVVGVATAGWVYWHAERSSAVSFTYIPLHVEAQEGYFTKAMWQRLADQIVERRPKVLWLAQSQWTRVVARRPEIAQLYVSRLHPELFWRVA